MLREQRLALINGGVLEESTIEQLYYESMGLLNNDDIMGSEYYAEGVGNAIQTAITKLQKMIEGIIEKVKSFFQKFNADKKNMVPNPNVKMDKKAFGKLKKILTEIKRLLSIPVKKIGKIIKDNKGIIKVEALVLAAGGLATALIYINKKGSLERAELNADIKYREYNETSRMITETECKLEKELDDAKKLLKKTGDIASYLATVDKMDGKSRRLTVDKYKMRGDLIRYGAADGEYEEKKEKFDTFCNGAIVSFYLDIGKALNAIVNAITSSINKLYKPKNK